VTALFEIGPADVADTSDDYYTPHWIFTAAGLVFDMDVAAPVNPSRRTCPALRYLTPVEDGLSQPWEGAVWINPPYSNTEPWVHRWAAHPDGMMLVPDFPEVKWKGALLAAADAMTLIAPHFLRADGVARGRPRWGCILAARGRCVEALARVASADRYIGGAYHVRPTYGKEKTYDD